MEWWALMHSTFNIEHSTFNIRRCEGDIGRAPLLRVNLRRQIPPVGYPSHAPLARHARQKAANSRHLGSPGDAERLSDVGWGHRTIRVAAKKRENSRTR